MDKIKLRRKRSLRFITTKLLLAAAKRKLDEKPVSGSSRRRLLLATAKGKLFEILVLGLPRRRYCLPEKRENICFHPSFESKQTS